MSAMTTNHKHKTSRTSADRGYTGSVAGCGDENRAAHGGVTYTETCRCGAERHVNQNGRHFERGPWSEPRS